MVQFKEIENFKLYGRCLSVNNGITEALITLDLGPRIISYSFIGGTNVMLSERDFFEKTCGECFDNVFYKGAYFENYGGHRLWVSPESMPETYYPDNNPVTYEINGNTVTVIQEPQKANGVQLKAEITMSENSAEMTVKHFGTNISDTTKTFALWPITVMAQGGTEIIPVNTNDTYLLSNRRLILWPYTDINDDRFFHGNKYITIKQNPDKNKAFKIGIDCNAGVGYYVIDDVVFSKEFTHNIGGNYPDGGASYESYTNETILEFETLSELHDVKPNETIEHTEKFVLYKKPCEFDRRDENSISEFIDRLK